MSAAAVTSVRPGWRIVFSRARRPVIAAPGDEHADRARERRHDAVTAGPPPAPADQQDARSRQHHEQITTDPAPTARRGPRPARRRRAAHERRRPVSAAVDLDALAHRRERRHARGAQRRWKPASTVTPMPTSSETTIVRVSMTVPLSGRSAPKDLNSWSSAGASAMPPSSPSDRADHAQHQAFVDDRAHDLAREAPSVRSSPNSRVRWATVIEKVLKMMNAPTTSAT